MNRTFAPVTVLPYIFLALLSQVAHAQGQTQLDSLLGVLEKTTDRENQIFLRVRIGNLYRQQDLKKATEFSDQTLGLAKKVKSPRALAFAYELAFDLASLAGDHPLGAKYVNLAIRALEGERDSLSVAKRLQLLSKEGGWLAPLTTSEKKIEYMLQSLDLYKRLGNREELAWAYFELGMLYRNRALYYSRGSQSLDDLDAKLALGHFATAEFNNRILNKKVDVAFSLSMQATMEKFLGNFTKAYQLNLRAIALYIQEGCKLGPAFVYSEMADILFHQQQYDSALFFVDKSIIASKEVGYTAGLWEFNDTKTKIYEAKHDYRHALESNRQARIERDKLYSSDQLNLIANIQNSFENKLKEEKIRTLNAEKSLQEKQANQALIIYGFILLLCVSAIIGLVVYLRERQKVVRQLKSKSNLDKAITRTLENQLRQVQLQALQGQLNPHFIYNALSSIQGLILQEDKEKAITYLNDFAQLSRLTLENSRKENIKLKDELIFLHRYLDLESLRHHYRFCYSVEVDERIDTDYETTPPMLIQPVVENAIRHGLIPKKTKGTVTIRFQNDSGGNNLVCVVEDDGVGRKNASVKKNDSHHSISTEVNEARLKLISEQQKLKEKYRMEIVDKYNEKGLPAGTKVSIFFATAESKKESAA